MIFETLGGCVDAELMTASEEPFLDQAFEIDNRLLGYFVVIYDD